MLKTPDGGRLSIGAMGLEGAQGAIELALDYSKKRKQFGRPIGSFQANAFKLADMATEIEVARLLLYKAGWRIIIGLRPKGISYGQAGMLRDILQGRKPRGAVARRIRSHERLRR
jgi:alkylation response protein AidB-like acyl-CoA dehydrogenase